MMSRSKFLAGRHVAVLLVCAACSQVNAQQVVESRASGNAVADLFYKIQKLEQEVAGLRGRIEEQEHKIRRLSKQRLEDYKSLDQRISSMSGTSAPPAGSYAASSVPAPAVQAASSVPAPAAAAPAGDPAMEQGAYQAAYDLVKRQRFEEALPAFQDFILLYPNGRYAPNAHYWLGELYLYEADLDNAIKEFNTVVQNFPRDSKAPDALFKLGKAHHVRGDSQTARIMLNRVLSDYGRSGSNAVSLARDYLNNELGR